jgi:hypothetical protein
MLVNGLVLILGLAGAVAPEGNPSEPLGLSLLLAPREIVPFEPVYATPVLSNRSARPVMVPDRILGTLEFWAAHEAGPFKRCGFGSQRGKPSSTRIALPPGQAISSSEKLFLYRPEGGDAEAFVFGETGSYRIMARVALGADQWLESDLVKVEVKRAAAADRAAAALLTERKTARMMQEWELSEEGARQLEKLVAQYPRSPLADSAHYMLAEFFQARYARTFRPDRGGDTELAAQAAGHFAAVSGRVTPLRARAVVARGELVWAVASLRRLANAGELLRELEAIRQTAATDELRKRIDELQAKVKALPMPIPPPE